MKKKRPTKSEWNQIVEMLASSDKDLNYLGINLLQTYRISNHYIRDAYKLINPPLLILKQVLLSKFKDYESVFI